MKNIILKNRTILYVLSLLLLVGCSGENKKSQETTQADKKFGKLEIEIPESLKDKPEVVTYIHEMCKVTDEYALLMDDVVENAGEYKGKDVESLGLMDKIKLTKIASEVGFKSMEILAKWGQYTDERISMEKDLSEDEIKALESVYERFEERIEQVKSRHAEFFAEEENNDK